jgi:hypothetical protein
LYNINYRFSSAHISDYSSVKYWLNPVNSLWYCIESRLGIYLIMLVTLLISTEYCSANINMIKSIRLYLMLPVTTWIIIASNLNIIVSRLRYRTFILLNIYILSSKVGHQTIILNSLGLFLIFVCNCKVSSLTGVIYRKFNLSLSIIIIFITLLFILLKLFHYTILFYYIIIVYIIFSEQQYSSVMGLNIVLAIIYSIE